VRAHEVRGLWTFRSIPRIARLRRLGPRRFAISRFVLVTALAILSIAHELSGSNTGTKVDALSIIALLECVARVLNPQPIRRSGRACQRTGSHCKLLDAKEIPVAGAFNWRLCEMFHTIVAARPAQTR
jgi:hypothetical protein